MTIIICDDDKTLQKILRRHIEQFFSDRNIRCQIFCCDSGEEVLAHSQPDLLFLDIQMSGKDGMQIARELRGRGWKTILIFVTAMSEYVYEAFDVNAFHYLIKPFSIEKLQNVLDKALQQLQDELKTEKAQPKEEKPPHRENPALLVKRGGVSTRVLFSDIIYAEVFNRKVMLHTVNGDIEYYGKLTDLSEQAGADFYRTHRAYLVNLYYVEKYNASTIWLEQGTALLSKKQFAGFVRQYMQYINRQKDSGHRKPL